LAENEFDDAAVESNGRRTFLKRLAGRELMALLGNFAAGAKAGPPTRHRKNADAGSAGAVAPDAATTASRGGLRASIPNSGRTRDLRTQDPQDRRYVYSAVGWSGCNTIMVSAMTA